MQESIFNNVNLEGLEQVSCVKNISDFGSSKSVTVMLKYTGNNKKVEIGSCCERLQNNSLNEKEPVKVFCKILIGEQEEKFSHRVWPTSMNDIIKKDVDIVDKMFDNFDDKLKKVYL